MITLLLPASRGPEDAVSQAGPLQAFLTEKLETPVRVEVAGDYAELERRLLGGEVDLAWAPPVLCARAEPTSRAILSTVRVGRSNYRSALVGRAGDALVATALDGKRAVWTDPLSTAGYLLPSAFLTLLGQAPGRVFASQRFLGSYRATLEAVASGEADVTAVYTPRADATAARQQMETLIGERSADLSAFAFTDEVPTDGLVIGDRVSRDRAPGLARALLELGSGTQNPLLTLLSAQRLVPARDAEYRPLRHAGRPRG